MDIATNTAPASRRPAVIAVAVLAAVVAVAFGSTFIELMRLWESDTNYSHGWLIPLFAAVPAWLHVRRNPVPAAGDPVLGTLYVFVGGLLHLASQALSMPPMDFFALVCALRGLAVAVGGRAWAGGFTFSLAFLFFMFPLPHAWTAYASIWLQDVVSAVSEFVIDPFIPCLRRGNSLYLAGLETPLVVAEECSGLRQIIAFFACGAYIAYFSGRGKLVQAVLLASAVPVAIAANVLRIGLMAAGASWFGTDWMKGTLHDAPALFSIPVGLLLYFGLAWMLGMTRPQPEKEAAP